MHGGVLTWWSDPRVTMVTMNVLSVAQDPPACPWQRDDGAWRPDWRQVSVWVRLCSLLLVYCICVLKHSTMAYISSVLLVLLVLTSLTS